jgi:hypothetical protein
MIRKLKIGLVYYKMILMINLGFSLAISAIIFPLFLQIFPLAFLTGGILTGILYVELLKKNQYYFFYNLGLSKRFLITFSLIINTIIGISILIMTNG